MKKIYLLVAVVFLSLGSRGQFGADNDCSPVIYGQPFAITGDIPVRATFRYQSPGGSCTGVLVNQQTDDQGLRQLFVTARHCIHQGTFGEGPLVNLNNFTFNFNFQSPNGDIQSTPFNQPFIVGNRAVDGNVNDNASSRYVFRSAVSLISETNPLVSGFGVDIALLEILTPIPSHFNVAYAGWMPYAPPGPNGGWVAPFHLVHHPSGDVKKYAQALQLAKFDNPLNFTCRNVTRTIDVIIRLFTGRKVSTERVCNAVDIPQYAVPLMHIGGVRGGSSGSPLFTDSRRLFANTSASLGECVNIFPTFGKFRNAFAIQAFKEALNPSYDVGANLWGINGRASVCRDSLRLSGNYFRANQYQPFNQLNLTAAQNIRAGRIDSDRDGQIASRAVTINANSLVDINIPENLTWTEERFLRVHAGASVTLTAGNSIQLLPGVIIDSTAVFETFIAPCPAPVSALSVQEGEVVVPPVPPAYDQVAAEDRAKSLNLDIPVKDHKPIPPTRLAVLQDKETKEKMTFRYAMPKEGKIVVYLADERGQKVKILVEEEKHQKGVFTNQIEIKDLKTGDYLLRYETSDEKDEKKVVI